MSSSTPPTSSRWTRSPRRRRARRRTPRSCAAPRPCATGDAQAMVGAGNTGATMAAALLRMGRIRGVARPAIAAPIPVPGAAHPQLLIDAGSTVDCAPEWLVQFASHGPRVRAHAVSASTSRRVGLLSNGEEPGKGDELRKQAYDAARAVPGLRRQRRGPRPHARHRRRDRHRRLHRQRRAQDARGRAARRGDAWCSACSTRRPRRGGAARS